MKDDLIYKWGKDGNGRPVRKLDDEELNTLADYMMRRALNDNEYDSVDELVKDTLVNYLVSWLHMQTVRDVYLIAHIVYNFDD